MIGIADKAGTPISKLSDRKEKTDRQTDKKRDRETDSAAGTRRRRRRSGRGSTFKVDPDGCMGWALALKCQGQLPQLSVMGGGLCVAGRSRPLGFGGQGEAKNGQKTSEKKQLKKDGLKEPFGPPWGGPGQPKMAKWRPKGSQKGGKKSSKTRFLRVQLKNGKSNKNIVFTTL